MKTDQATSATQDYTANINVNTTPAEAFKKIATVDGWWAKNFKGGALNVGDTFKVTFGSTTWVEFKIAEAVPGKKSVWLVTNCYLGWLNNKTEWNNTKVVWEISGENGSTQIKMTHVGLVPGVECYEDCRTGWNGHVKGSLVKYINEGKGMPE